MTILRHTNRRRILTTLQAHGPKTARELARVLAIPAGTSANLCSAMAIEGELGETLRPGKRGRLYSAASMMLIEDQARLAGMVDAYGYQAVLAEIERARESGDTT